jgi:sugar porter (SP) family MFS transporter
MSINEKPVAPPAHDEGLFEESSSSASEKNKQYSDVESARAAAEALNERGNILLQYTQEQVMQMGRNYALKYDLDPELFARGAALARTPADFNSMAIFSEDEKIALNLEATKKWQIPGKLVAVIALASMAAAVQGMDESVINGANLFYPEAMGIGSGLMRDSWLEGLVNLSPYLCCSVIACWLSDPMNRAIGRKWTVFWTCFISFITCVWLALTNTWWHLLIARFFLGFGIGIKLATVPAYAAECAPPHIRGALVMLWQFFTAVGIMFGYVAVLAFYYVGSHGIGKGLNWRLMLGLACIPALIVLCQVPFVPESPRWLMGKNRHREAFELLDLLRSHELSAARDCFYQYVLLKEEAAYDGMSTFRRLVEMFTVRRNRNGALGAWIVMFMQQFCGINVIAYYSLSIFIEAKMGIIPSLLALWGFGMLNFLFAIPAFYTIDTFGRRNLLLTTFPLMAVFLLMAGMSFFITDTKVKAGICVTGIYLFCCVYLSGEGPVPFTYSAEAFPLYIRDLGMGFATATCWFFNFVLALTWPSLRNAFTPQGAFGWYAAWNVVGFFLVLWFLPETKGLLLEELDEVFSVSATEHAKYQTKNAIRNVQVWLLRRKLAPLPPLYRHQRMAVTHPDWNDKTEVTHQE